MRARLQAGDGQLLVLVVGNGDRKDVEFFIADQIDPLGVDLFNLKLLLRPLAPSLLAVRDGDHFDVRMGHVPAEMVVAHAETDHSSLQLCHDFCFS